MSEFEIELKNAQRHLAKNDIQLKVIIKRYGDSSIRPHKDYFQTLIGSIISQQLSTKAADTIYKRFLLLFSLNGKPVKRFPAPDEIVRIPDIKMRECGMSYPKAAFVKDLCNKVMDGTIKIHKMNKLSNDEIINEL